MNSNRQLGNTTVTMFVAMYNLHKIWFPESNLTFKEFCKTIN